MENTTRVIEVDTWTPEKAASLSLFSDWEIIHEISNRESLQQRRPRTLQEEIQAALEGSSSSSSEQEEEVDEKTFLPRKDPTLRHQRKKSASARNVHVRSLTRVDNTLTQAQIKLQEQRRLASYSIYQSSPSLLKKHELSYSRGWLNQDLRLSRQSVESDYRDSDSGVDDLRRLVSSSNSSLSSCTCGGGALSSAQEIPFPHTFIRGDSPPQTHSSSSIHEATSPQSSAWEAVVGNNSVSSISSSPPHSVTSCDSSSTTKKVVAPSWPHQLPELEPFTLSLEEEKPAPLSQTAALARLSPELSHDCVQVGRKILLIGDSGVGKSSYLQRYINRDYSPNYQWTVGVDFALKVIQWSDTIKVKLQLWDIAGQERFTSMTRVYYKDAHACIIMFDLTQKSSFENCVRWKNDLDSKCSLPDGNPIPCMLLANKCDLSLERQVDQESIEKMVKEMHFNGWTETSVKTGLMVDEAMKFLIDELMRTYTQSKPKEETELSQSIHLQDEDDKKKKSSCAC